MKFAFLATTLLSSIAMAAPQAARAPQAPQAAHSTSTVTFRTHSPQPAPSFALIPTVAIGSSSFSKYEAGTDSESQSDLSAGTSYEAGLLAEFGRSTVVFQTGLLYMSEAFKTTSSQAFTDGSSARVNFTGTFQYLGVPLAVKARARIAEGIRLAGRIGVTPAALLDSKIDFNATVKDSSGRTLQSQSGSSNGDGGAIRKGQVFAVVGAGPEFRIARNQNIRVEATYERMLFNMATSESSVFMHSISGTLAYGLAF